MTDKLVHGLDILYKHFFPIILFIFKGDFRKIIAIFLILERGLILFYKAASFAFKVAMYQYQAKHLKSSLANESCNL